VPSISGFERSILSDIHGNTDSEHVAALYVSFLFLEAKKRIESGPSSREQKDAKIQSISSQDGFELEDMKTALLCAIRAVIEAQKELNLLSSESLSDTANSLNLCATDGEKIVATRFRNHPTEQPASLYWTRTGGIRAVFEPEEQKPDDETISLQRRYVIIASEPTSKLPPSP
jgi:glutamine amidotransferase